MFLPGDGGQGWLPGGGGGPSPQKIDPSKQKFMTPFYDLVTAKKVAMVAFIGGRGPKWVGGS